VYVKSFCLFGLDGSSTIRDAVKGDLSDELPMCYTTGGNRRLFDGWFCPVPGCGGKVSKGWNLHRHFIERHERDLVKLPTDQILYPRCESCDMQVNPESTRHEGSKLCARLTARKVQREAAVKSARSLDQRFTAYGKELERVEVFRYL